MICTFDACEKPAKVRGLCSTHHWRWSKYGDPGREPSPPSLQERLFRKLDTSAGPDGCWIWLGYIGSTGYGNISVGTHSVGAHRVAYELAVGPIPDGLHVDHLCRVRACCNPAHLEAVTPSVNAWRGVDATRAKVCPQGHPRELYTTVERGSGYRNCRACRVLQSRRAQRPAKAARAATAGALSAVMPGTNRLKVTAFVRALSDLGWHVVVDDPDSILGPMDTFVAPLDQLSDRAARVEVEGT